MDPFNVEAKMDPDDPTKMDISFNIPSLESLVEPCPKAQKYSEWKQGRHEGCEIPQKVLKEMDAECLRCSWHRHSVKDGLMYELTDDFSNSLCPAPEIKIQSTSGKVHFSGRRNGLIW